MNRLLARALLVLASVALAEGVGSAAQEANGPATTDSSPGSLLNTIQELQEHIRDQDRRIAELEGHSSPSLAVASAAATRFSYLDLDEEGLGAASRGELRDWTLGLNWYWNPNVRVMADYVLAVPHRIDTESSASIFMMRFQLDFQPQPQRKER